MAATKELKLPVAYDTKLALVQNDPQVYAIPQVPSARKRLEYPDSGQKIILSPFEIRPSIRHPDRRGGEVRGNARI